MFLLKGILSSVSGCIMINPWIQFIISAAVILIAGSRLTRSAAVIATNTGIGMVWAGALLLPLATSLPELVTTLRAVLIDAPDLATGNILGSCLYNLSLLALIDLVEGRGPLTARIKREHILTASLSAVTICLALIGMLGIIIISLGWVGFETVLIALVYLGGSRLLAGNERRGSPLTGHGVFSDPKKLEKRRQTGRAVIQFVFGAALIVIAGILITDASDRIALETGLGQSFVGSIFLAISTSLPETVTTISAVRLGFLDMAVANVFGANYMNLFILFLADMFYRPGPLLQAVGAVNMLSALMVVLLSVLFIFAIIYRPGRVFARMGLDSLLVLAGYILAVYMIFITGGN